jgi:virginiamycin B lyase
MRTGHLAGLLLLGLLSAREADAQRATAGDTLVPLQEWTVPWEKSRPRDPYVAPDGAVWFVGQEGNYVARLDPSTGRFRRFEIDSGTHPHTVIVDAQGRAWYAGNRNGMIGRIDPRTGAITRYPMPDSAARDPHTMVFDRNGDIWFTAQNSNFIGKLETRTGRIRLVQPPRARARPYGIVIDANGRPWFNLFGTNAVGSVDPVNFEITVHPLPNERTRGRRIALTPDGGVWYVDYSRGFLSRVDPRSGAVREFAIPGGGAALPYALSVDDRGRLWFVETGRQPNRFVGFDPTLQQFFGITPVASGGGTIRHMTWDAQRRVLWFGTDNNTIGKADVKLVSPRPTS